MAKAEQAPDARRPWIPSHACLTFRQSVVKVERGSEAWQNHHTVLSPPPVIAAICAHSWGVSPMGENVHFVLTRKMPSGVPVSSKNLCLCWKPQWKPSEAMTADRGMHGRPPEVLRLSRERSARGRRFARNGGCEPGANLLAASSARRVPIVRTWLRTSAGNLAPTGISRAFGCVRIVREGVREGSFMGLVFTISVECVGDRWEWSLLMVTANGHWLGCVARCWPKIDAARTNFC